MRREGVAGVIRLNRPKALNALTLEMGAALTRRWTRSRPIRTVALVLLEGAGERGLCAGGDIRGLYESRSAGGDLGKFVLARRISSECAHRVVSQSPMSRSWTAS